MKDGHHIAHFVTIKQVVCLVYNGEIHQWLGGREGQFLQYVNSIATVLKKNFFFNLDSVSKLRNFSVLNNFFLESVHIHPMWKVC